jgi:hypothetical protein
MMPTPVSAAERLAVSRERLRVALQTGPSTSGGTTPSPIGAIGRSADAAESPGVDFLMDALRQWWTQHPWHLAGNVAAGAARAAVQPLAQRHPWALVLGAALVGGALFKGRAWRWVLKPALFAGLAPQVLRSVLNQVPVQSWVSLLSTLGQPAVPKRPDTH